MKSLTWVQRLIHKGVRFVTHEDGHDLVYEATAEHRPMQSGHGDTVGKKHDKAVRAVYHMCKRIKRTERKL